MTIITRCLLVLVLLLGSVSAYETHKVSSLTQTLASVQSSLEARTEALEGERKTIALKSELQGLKEDVSLLLAQSTLVIQANAQANTKSLKELRGKLDEQSKKTGTDANALNPNIAEWLRKYEAGRTTGTN